SEALIHLYPASKSSLQADCTKLPVQFAIFTGLDSTDPFVSLSVSLEDALKEYYRSPGALPSWWSSWGTVAGITFEINRPKILALSEDSLFAFRDIGVKLVGKAETKSFSFAGVAILTGATNFSWALHIAQSLGTNVARSEVMDVFIKQPFFRKALATERLRPKAEEIQSKVSRRASEGFDYPPWEFELDVAKLNEIARSLGSTDEDVQQLLAYLASTWRGGHLLWHYESYIGFTCQWTVVNVTLLVIVVVLHWCLKRRRKGAIRPIIRKIGFPLIIMGINYWIFQQRPKGLDFYYWLLPGVLMISSVLWSLVFLPAGPKSTDGETRRK